MLSYAETARLDRLKQFARNDSSKRWDTSTSDLHSTSVKTVHGDDASSISRLR